MTALVMLVVVLLSWKALQRIELQVKADVKGNLQTVLRTTHESIHGWADNRMNHAHHFTLLEGFKSSVRDLLETPSTKKALKKSKALLKLRNVMAPLLKHNNDFGFFVISPERINIASLRDENLGEANLLQNHGDYLDEIFEGEPQFEVDPMSSTVLYMS